MNNADFYIDLNEYIKDICAFPNFYVDKLTKHYKKYNNLPWENPFLEQKENIIELEKLQLKFAVSCKNSHEKGLYLPLYQLIYREKLPRIAVHFIMTALAWEIEPSFSEKINKLKPFKGCTSPTFEMAVAMYRTCYNIKVDFNFHSMKLSLFPLFLKISKENRMPQSFRLRPQILSFLLDNSYKSPCYITPYILSKNNSYAFNSVIEVYIGKAGLGKKHFLKDRAKENHNNIIFVDTRYLCLLDSVKFKEAEESIMVSAYINFASVCFYDFDCISEKIEYRFCRLINSLQKHNINVAVTVTEELPQFMETLFSCQFIELEPFTYEKQKSLWKDFFPAKTEEDINRLVSAFSMVPKQIVSAAKEIAFTKPENTRDFYRCCYHQSSSSLSKLAQNIVSNFTWDDLVLPPNLKNEILQSCNHVKQKYKVYDQWGFSSRITYGKGLNILFTGPPGTGKTMLANIISNELNMELYRIDISALVSKYIGETQENLGKVFDEAQNSSCILFFDEMDSLFGKRSETQDAHDKYTNMETSYLLQRIEAYDGVVLMATNYLSNLDEAFIRRIHFLFHIPFPTYDLRLKLWKKAFPKEAPINNNIDYEFLSRQFELSGSVIKNISLSAAIFAAREKKEITMGHIIKALKIELLKQEKILLKEDLGVYYHLLLD